MGTMKISLPQSLEAFVEAQVAERGYGTAIEYVRELIRHDRDRSRLRNLLLEGAASEPAGPADETYFEALRERVRGPGSRKELTLRFRDEGTHRALRKAAEELGMSMNELAERAIEHELSMIEAELEEKLGRAVRLLGSGREQQRADDRRADAEVVARAEVEEDDPLRSRAAEQPS